MAGDFRGTVVLDFDGVLHSYTSGWQGATIISDPPTVGAVQFVHDLMSWGYDVVVASTRCAEDEGRHAVAAWLIMHGFPILTISRGKPPGVVYLDDRALRFEGPGQWPDEEEVAMASIPWMKRGG